MGRLSLKNISKIVNEGMMDGIKEFAEKVLNSARPGIFPDKSFISEVWKTGFQNMPIDQFKKNLLACHKAGLLVLSRADMTNILPQDAVKQSEIRVGNSTFHFVKFNANQNSPFSQSTSKNSTEELIQDIDGMIKLMSALKQKVEGNQKFSRRGIQILKAQLERISQFLEKNPNHLE